MEEWVWQHVVIQNPTSTAKAQFLDELQQLFNVILNKADTKIQGEFTVQMLFCNVRQEKN